MIDECDDRLRRAGEGGMIKEKPVMKGRGKRWVEGMRGWARMRVDEIESDDDMGLWKGT